MKERITKLEMDKETSDKLKASHKRSVCTMKAELRRLMKIEAEYLKMLDTHYGGKIEKINAFMRTNLISAECWYSAGIALIHSA